MSATLLDILLPGGDGWPSASAALDGASPVLARLSDPDAAWLSRQDAALEALPVADRVAAVARLEEAEPFGRVLAALYDAYYNSAPALAEVRRLVEAGPRDPAPAFDPTLLATVIARQAGRRRL